jgi:catechol 2,3-dioxygenase-like lactoylglutathione lyase family enzyme
MMQAVVPAIRVKSYLVSKPFYGAIGFHEQWTHQFEAGFPIFASVARDGMEVFLTEHTGDCEFGALVHFNVPSVDAVFEELRGAGIAVAEPPNNHLGPNIRSMVVVDPDGNRLKFLTVAEAEARGSDA